MDEEIEIVCGAHFGNNFSGRILGLFRDAGPKEGRAASWSLAMEHSIYLHFVLCPGCRGQAKRRSQGVTPTEVVESNLSQDFDMSSWGSVQSKSSSRRLALPRQYLCVGSALNER